MNFIQQERKVSKVSCSSAQRIPFLFHSIFNYFYLTLCLVLSETLEQCGTVKLLHGYFSLFLKLDITVNSVLVHSPLEGHQFLTTLIFHTLKRKHLIGKETSLRTSAALSCCIHRKADIRSSSKRSANYSHFTLPTTGNSQSKFNIRLCKCSLGKGEGGQEGGVLQFQRNLDEWTIVILSMNSDSRYQSSKLSISLAISFQTGWVGKCSKWIILATL